MCHILPALLNKCRSKCLKAVHCHSYTNNVIPACDPTSGKTVALLASVARPPVGFYLSGAGAVLGCRVMALMLRKGVCVCARVLVCVCIKQGVS